MKTANSSEDRRSHTQSDTSVAKQSRAEVGEWRQQESEAGTLAAAVRSKQSHSHLPGDEALSLAVCNGFDDSCA